MTNILQEPYNISSIISENALNDPGNFLSAINTATHGWLIVAILIAFGAILFMAARRDGQNPDGVSIIYAGLITSFVGLFLFLISVTTQYKLITWTQLMPFLIITGMATIAHFAVKKFS